MKTIANKRFWSVILVFVLVFNVVLTGCSTTTSSINYASAEQPKGEYKFEQISVSSSSNRSALQRFYSEFPSDKYVVVAIEKQSSNIPILITLGSTLLGGVIGYFAIDEPTETGGPGIGLAASSVLFGTAGFFVGNHLFSPKYIITYVER